MRVLIVEDEALVRMLVRDLLEEAGFSCEEATDAGEALAFLDRLRGPAPDLLVTDLNLGPGADGLALAGAARRCLPGLPVLFVTGNPERLVGRLPGPGERILPKPFEAAALSAAALELARTGRAGLLVPALGPAALAA